MPIDYKKYPKNWKTEIVPRILKRAGNRCEVCGLRNGQIVYSAKLNNSCRRIWFQNKQDAERLNPVDIKPVRVVLTIAHLDQDAENHNIDDNRLMAMCQYCHLKYDIEQHRKNK